MHVTSRASLSAVLAVVLAGCWSGSVAAPPRSAVVLHIPFKHPVRVELAEGDQRTVTASQYCVEADITDWAETFRRDGFEVQVGYVSMTLYGASFGLRFRRPGLYGDLYVNTRDDMCVSYELRLQAGVRPAKWRTKFKIINDEHPMGFGVTQGPYFDDDERYPPVDHNR